MQGHYLELNDDPVVSIDSELHQRRDVIIAHDVDDVFVNSFDDVMTPLEQSHVTGRAAVL